MERIPRNFTQNLMSMPAPHPHPHAHAHAGAGASRTRVVVGMSGGVDSSVAALLLKKQGYEVIGLFMKNWEDNPSSSSGSSSGSGSGPSSGSDPRPCQATRDYEDVAKVCQQLDISYYPVEFIDEYRERVFNQMLSAQRQGLTPNPDILCNREIKFKLFFKCAMDMGADFLATGHYCQIDRHQLLKGSDPDKDQSYFLYTLKRELLGKLLFPLGHLHKSQVRELAALHRLATAEKKDSTGICFIGKRKFRPFLEKYIPTEPGNFQTIDGTVVGRHRGAFFYTIGQRKGLGLGGPGRPWFVVGKDLSQNVILVERGEHPDLFAECLVATNLSWVASDFSPALPYACQAKIRYRQRDQDCAIERIDGERIYVRFATAQRAIAPGQSIVFYQDQLCLGGAVIERAQ